MERYGSTLFSFFFNFWKEEMHPVSNQVFKKRNLFKFITPLSKNNYNTECCISIHPLTFLESFL